MAEMDLKGCDLFGANGDVPLISLSGYTLSIALLIEKYLPNNADSSEESDSKSEKPKFDAFAPNPKHASLHHFLFTQLVTINEINEPTLSDLLKGLQSVPDFGSICAQHLINQLKAIEYVHDMFDIFRRFMQLIPPIHLQQLGALDPSSLFGIFLRKLLHTYDKAPFETVVQFFQKVVNYVKVANIDESTMDSSDATGVDITTLRCPFEIDAILYKYADRVSTHCGMAPDTVLSNGTRAILDQITTLFPDMSSVHYLNYVGHLFNGEYISSLTSLHKYFDYVSSSFDCDWVSFINYPNQLDQARILHEKGKKMQYALLVRAMFYYSFGHYNLALQQIGESIEWAQNQGDNACVANALFLLVQFLQEQSGNKSFTKTILESCVRNTDATASVHAGGLLNLAKWHLEHIESSAKTTQPQHIWQFLRYLSFIGSQNNMYRELGESHLIRGNCWNAFGNKVLSKVCYDAMLINYSRFYDIQSTNITLTAINYATYHLPFNKAVALLTTMKESKYVNSQYFSNIGIDETLLILHLKQSLSQKNLTMASKYQSRLAELIPEPTRNFQIYLDMMFLHARLRFQYKQFMESSQILNRLISLCNSRNQQRLTVPFLILLSEINLEAHNEATIALPFALRALAITKSYNLDENQLDCIHLLAEIHIRFGNTAQSLRLVRQSLPLTLQLSTIQCADTRKNGRIIDAYLLMSRAVIADDNSDCWIALQYLHTARIWCVKIMGDNESFDFLGKKYLQKIYYYLARVYDHISDVENRDKAARKLELLLS